MAEHVNNFPKLHNAAWPGVVGKEPGTANPPIDLATMLDYTAAACVDGVKFDGVDLFLFAPHVDIDSTDEDLKALAGAVSSRGLVIGSVVAPVWPPTGGGSAMDAKAGRKKFLAQVKKGCRIAAKLRELGVRPGGIVRIDSACGVDDWSKDPEGNQKKIATTFKQAAKIARDSGERLAMEGEICWGGMHSWKKAIDLLERVGEPETVGFQADMAHTLLYTQGFNSPEDRIVPEGFDWWQWDVLDAAFKTMTNALRPWTIDFHVAQNDATVHGTGSHDKTGRHCLPNAPGGKLNIPHVAGFWLRDGEGKLTKAFRHICWDGCMFPNDVMAQGDTWNQILGSMLAVRDTHGWRE
jgi:sugar phosphate isomerase/epimerase